MLLLGACDEQITLTQTAQDPNDNCTPFRQQISDARRTEIQKQTQNAVAGAVVGGILGALVAGGDSQQRARGALIGAAAGGLAGYSATYYNQKKQRSSDAAALLRSVNADASRESALVSRTGKAANSLRSCRISQLAALESRVKRQQVSKSQAKAELRQIRAKVSGDNRIISAAFNGIGQRVDAYVDATAAETGVNRAIVANQRAAQNARDRRARAATPNVARVSTQSSQIRAADKRASDAVDRKLNSLEILLG
ncbi:YMGG-like glycine zipper-containing protein [Pseudaestuariivita atlantica]|uniref:YMGG-like glycine zipper-containing protein n=1 Tax=Pseudaestuariivita atlantica TaxID=1317121 RepID=UPI0013F3E933|nr:YMGG-like glycine zipper-containing protein [Pseudaestuariivita atlantica]